MRKAQNLGRNTNIVKYLHIRPPQTSNQYHQIFNGLIISNKEEIN